MQGSQFRNKDGWLNDPLSGILGPFMTIPIPLSFGPQNIPYLSAVTQLTGSGTNALAAVPTANIVAPFIVKIAITGDSDYQLIVGVFTGPGYVTPNDQATSGKTWQQIS
jgi:hypothetical protein